ncbi:hypothetical protein UK23_32805 [Lentzea aerocolonigenes]|uniref:Bacterial transcriptional activator domain-containing protein n=1 Tax=Lentzea aerocolonigenes TaxID=68170 RepID=A0A0F0GNL8_LENAE|nr:BTAD domain-containing putative transcriptional regulator [Lentzea aerocolonigenes]KJK43547.1 hypothetical protein UK23_32805 [Lentzea aerocolonigenes]
MRYEAQFFGPFRVWRDGVPLAELNGGRTGARTLLKWFLLHPEQSVEATRLAALLWPREKSVNCTKKLYVTLHALRRALEPELTGRQPSRFVSVDQDSHYRFDLCGMWRTDVGEVERLWAMARSAAGRDDTAGEIRACERLLDHYRQGFLPEDVYEDAFAPHRSVQDRGHDAALRRLLRLYRGAGLNYEALTTAMEILDRDPYAEVAITALVEVHLDQGNSTVALSRLDSFITTAEEELGVEPSSELLRLHEQIRNQSS